MKIIKTREELLKLLNSDKDLIIDDDVTIEFSTAREDVRNVKCKNLSMVKAAARYDLNISGNFTGWNFNGRNFNGENFNGGDFNGRDFNGRDFTGGNFTGGFTGGNFSGGISTAGVHRQGFHRQEFHRRGLSYITRFLLLWRDNQSGITARYLK